MRLRRLLPVALVLAAAACGGANEGGGGKSSDAGGGAAAETAGTSAPMTVSLATENASGQTGTATLQPGGDTFEVHLEVAPPKKFKGEYQHAHVHDVTCAEYRKIQGFDAQLGTVVDELNDLEDGESTSTVYAPLAKRATGAYSINVHEQNDPYTVVACGDIPRR